MPGPYRIDRTLIRVAGPEARSFLQSVLTQDFERPETPRVQYAALLSPQGKVVADVMAWAAPACVILETDPTRGGELSRRLAMYKLRAQATLEDATGEFAVAVSDGEFAEAARDPRLPGLGWRALAPRAKASAFPDGAACYDRKRIALGVPDLARDAAPEEVFALEALLEELNGVDFRKGCFIGQENVSRMKRRATARRKFCPIIFDGPAPAPGAPVRAGETELGTVRSGGPGRALALIRLDRAFAATSAGETLRVDGREARLDPPPWLILPPRDPGP